MPLRSQSATPDLRDDMPLTPDWSDDGRVYVDGRVTRNQARQLVCKDTGALYRWSEARRCYMRKLRGQEALDFTSGEMDEFWAVCEKDAPGALAMWVVEAP